MEELGDSDAVLIDQRGHGRSEIGQPPFDWWDLGRDVVAVLDALEGDTDLIGVGHSSGATALVMAEVLRPGTFTRLVLVEPIVFPPPFERTEEHPLATAVERRRPSFATREDALRAYRDRPPFMTWEQSAFDAYLDHGFSEVDDQWTLRCRPDVEAEFYRASTAHGVWDRMGDVECEVDVVIGTESDSHSVSLGRNLAERFADGRLQIVDSATHFVPMEQPGRLASLIASS
jgi:pimeloyl-ACP methyl ester carboxylesterase